MPANNCPLYELYRKGGCIYEQLFATACAKFTLISLGLLQILNDMMVPPNTWLVAIDIEAIQSCIPHDVGLTTIAKFFTERDRICWPLNQFVLDLLSHILHSNIFSFDGIYYKQCQRHSNGSMMRPIICQSSIGGLGMQLVRRRVPSNVPVPDIMLAQVNRRCPRLMGR